MVDVSYVTNLRREKQVQILYAEVQKSGLSIISEADKVSTFLRQEGVLDEDNNLALVHRPPINMTSWTKAEKQLFRYIENQPRVLSDLTRVYGLALTNDKKAAKDFLVRAGIINEDGKLTPHYKI